MADDGTKDETPGVPGPAQGAQAAQTAQTASDAPPRDAAEAHEHRHIVLPGAPDDAADGTAADAASPGLRNSRGWDGKLRLPKKEVVLANPEALSDPDYSDDDNVVPGEPISADEDILDDEDPETDEIVCTHARIRSLAALRLGRFRQCARLCLRQNAIESLVDEDGAHPLAGLADCLRELDLYDNLIAHMRGVEQLPGLTSLDLSFNKIRHIKHLQPLRQLASLYLVANKIGSVDGLAGVAPATLRLLELGSNRLRSVEPLAGFGLVALEELWLAKNKITSLAGVAGMPCLRLLSIQSNRIRDLSPLRAVPTLEELYVSHNALTSLASLAGEAGEAGVASEPADPATPDSPAGPILPRLRVLDVANNQLASLHGIEHMTALEEVWAASNRLADFTDVERTLADKTHLTTVYFEGNPLQLRAPALYRNKVRLALPQVQQIDATYVRDT